MENNKINTIANIILKYEYNFDGRLKHGSKNKKSFSKDIISILRKDWVEEILEYYKNQFISSNNTNSSTQQRKDLYHIVSTLEGLV